MGFPRGSMAKNLPANAGGAGSFSGLGRSLEKEPTPVFFLGNHMDRGAWWTIVYGVTKESDII